MAFIKSHSNYVLKSKHQNVNDGTIYERDITTIGGVNQFSKGMTPIYRSNNFIISVRNDTGSTNVYNNSKWEKSTSASTIWTLENVSGMTSNNDDSNDVKIVLKQDYYDFCDFAYYGSLSELFRASVTDILDRFPGELYCTSNNIYYTTYETINQETIEDSFILGGENLYNLDNPFGIDIYSLSKHGEDANPLKFFADEGYKNYQIIKKDGNLIDIKSWNVEEQSDKTCKGGKICNVVLNKKVLNERIDISVYIGDDDKIFYMCDKSLEGMHIRPKEEFISEFYNKCDNFQKLIMNRKSTPLYKAVFSVLKENEYGFYRDFETFVFPTTFGGYNIIANDYGFSDYTKRLADIGEFYDNRVSDNIYRSMTHEAIKNFDWTYTKEYTQGDEEEYVFGGQKIQKALRVIGREFDEIKSYIDNIKNIRKLSYDERSNMPDYFLKYSLDSDGWDIKLPYPYEGRFDDDKNEWAFTISSQDKIVKPYSSSLIEDNMNKYGFFMYKGDIDDEADKLDIPNIYSGTDYHFASAKSSGSTWYRCTTRNRIKPYTSDKEYSYHDMSNEFLRRLRLNSKYIWRHKGTVEGIEMILGMFGLKSKRFCDLSNKGFDADYEISEYSWSTEPIEDKWDCLHNMYYFDWVNSTKNIVYDYRGTSEYTNASASSDYVSYQGLPVGYKDVGKRRFLYPNFNKDEKYDGDPYFQMKGGWQNKVYEDGNKKYYFQFNEDFTKIIKSDTKPIYKETVKSIKNVNTLSDLLSISIGDTFDGDICFVSSIYDNVMVVEDTVYNIYTEYNDKNERRRFVKLMKEGGSIRLTSSKYFSDDITVFDENISPKRYDIENVENGFIIKAYINDTNSEPTEDNIYLDRKFLCISENDGEFSITTVTIIESDDKHEYTNYFLLDNAQFANMMAREFDVVGEDKKVIENGWRRLKYTDDDYKRISTLTNYFKGNNPHNGNLTYDNGYEYFSYFNTLFKYASENYLFDERCHDDVDSLIDELNDTCGFKSLSKENYNITINEDSKVHYFGNYQTYLYKWDNKEKKCECDKELILSDIPYNSLNDMDCGKYNLEKIVYDKNNQQKCVCDKSSETMIYKNVDVNDGVTNQIINTKRMSITFFVDKFSKEYTWTQIKYIDDVVMNYLTQLIPSTAIVDIKYKTR